MNLKKLNQSTAITKIKRKTDIKINFYVNMLVRTTLKHTIFRFLTFVQFVYIFLVN